jgi:hypothetical protein
MESKRKTIQINPNFFKLGKSKKKKKPSFRGTIKPNNLKKQLLSRIKSHQQREKETTLPEEKAEVETFQNDFNSSLNYLQTMIKQKKKKKRKKTQKNKPNINTQPFNNEQSDGIKPQLVNVKDNLPKAPPYGCLKNGTKPTYSQWIKTMKKKPIKKSKPTIVLPPPPPPTKEILERKEKLNKLKETMATPKTEPIMKNVQKKRTIKIFKLGKNKGKVGVLIKSGKTRKKIREEHKIIHSKSMATIKHYLRKHNLIKAGTAAPEKVLRKIYEDSFLAGDIYNKNAENLLHNYMQNEL